MAREPGYRSKVAVSSSDQRVDCVGACVGVRGNRIKNIVDELAGERIDIVRWSDDLQVLIPNALQPAEVEEVILCQMLGRAIVLVREDQLSLAIGRRGQNVRLASKLCGWDIEIMTREELDEQIERAVVGFLALEGVDDELAEKLVGEGFLSYDDLSVIEPDALDGDGRADRRAGRRRSSSRPKPRPRRPKRRPRTSGAGNASRSGSKLAGGRRGGRSRPKSRPLAGAQRRRQCGRGRRSATEDRGSADSGRDAARPRTIRQATADVTDASRRRHPSDEAASRSERSANDTAAEPPTGEQVAVRRPCSPSGRRDSERREPSA